LSLQRRTTVGEAAYSWEQGYDSRVTAQRHTHPRPLPREHIDSARPCAPSIPWPAPPQAGHPARV